VTGIEYAVPECIDCPYLLHLGEEDEQEEDGWKDGPAEVNCGLDWPFLSKSVLLGLK
jgi:hypothetical protein